MDDNAAPVSEEQRIITGERLRLLSIAAYIRGGMIAVFSSFFLIYVVFLVGMTLVPDSAWTNNPPASSSTSRSAVASDATPPPTAGAAANQAPPKIIFRIMAAVFGLCVLVGWTVGGLTAYAGRCIHKRRRKVLIYVAAAINCMFLPYGTLFGIAAILVLSSPAAQREFAHPSTGS